MMINDQWDIGAMFLMQLYLFIYFVCIFFFFYVGRMQALFISSQANTVNVVLSCMTIKLNLNGV